MWRCRPTLRCIIPHYRSDRAEKTIAFLMKKFSERFSLIIIWAITFLMAACSGEQPIPEEEEQPQEPIENPVTPPEKIEGFDTPITKEFDGGTITYQYNEEVIVVTEAMQKNLVKTEADTILYFSPDTPESQLLEIDDIITSSIIDEKTPYGLGNKVISATQDGGYIKVVTTSAPLDDIFKELIIDATIPLITDTISAPIEDCNGNLCEVSVIEFNESRTPHTAGSRNMLSTKVAYNPGKNNGMYANGSIYAGAMMTIDFDKNLKKSDFWVEFYGGYEAELGITASWNNQIQIFPANNKTYHTIVSTIVPVGVVVLRPFIGWSFGVEANLKGDIGTKIGKQYGVKLGRKNGQWFHENLPIEGTNNPFDNLAIDAKGSITPVIKFYFATGLYTTEISAGVEAPIKGCLSTEFSLNEPNIFVNHPDLNLDITAEAALFFNAKFLHWKEYKKKTIGSWNIYSNSWPLLPALDRNSFAINKRTNSSELIYDVEYEMTGGLLNAKGVAAKLFQMKPSFKVYDDDDEIMHLISDKEISEAGKQKYTYELKGLNKDKIYTGVPCLVLKDHTLEEKGKTFPSACVNDEHPHAVDMALPSGTMWCCMNVGATKPADFGTYYASPITDVPRQTFGEGYSVPTRAQYRELYEHTTHVRTKMGSVYGLRFTASNGNSIFLPAMGSLWWGEDDDGTTRWVVNSEGNCNYWTKNPSSYNNYFYFFEHNLASDEELHFGDRKVGSNRLPIRPVYIEPKE